MTQLVLSKLVGDVAVVTLNRPDKLNALSAAVEEALLLTVRSADVQGAAAVVFNGNGRAFCAGADVTEFRGLDPASILDYYKNLGALYEIVADLPMPTVAALHGFCVGGGFEFALACDIRVADADTQFGLPEVGLGIVPSSGGLTRLVRAVGLVRAKEIMLWRDRFSAEQAHADGLVTEVVPSGHATEIALAGATRMAELPRLAVQVTKQAADVSTESSRAASLLIEQLAYAALAQTADATEAALAFEEKRQPRFTGR
ncbi:MAG TPA: enoyl-CoA hydratase/isomerase family protein [Actinomycetes bacterium]|nr:enoyl-CoA hydratase/isomerase family protein [Actinomycetes bacterium]